MTTNALPFSTNASFTVIKNWPLPHFSVTDSGTLLTIAASGLSVDVFKTPFRFAFLKPDGTVRLSDTNTFGLGIASNAASANFNMPGDEQYYGGGLIEGYPLSYHGQQRTLYNAYTPFQGGYMPNLPVPLIISSMGYGVFFDNTLCHQLSQPTPLHLQSRGICRRPTVRRGQLDQRFCGQLEHARSP
jgi:hypothetical protein